MSKIIITDGQTDEILDHIQRKDVVENDHERDMPKYLEKFTFTAYAGKDKRYAEHLTDKNRIIIHGEDGEYREFVIVATDQYKEDKTSYIEVKAYASYQELVGSKIIRAGRTAAMTAEAHANLILAGTEVKLGRVAHTGLRTIVRDNHTNPFSALKSLANEFNLELNFRIEVDRNKIARYVDLVTRTGQRRGRIVEFGKDIESIRRKQEIEPVTELLVLGPEKENGERLEVTVQDEDARRRWGRRGQHIVDIYEPQTEDQDITEERLYTLGRTELDKRINKVISYEIGIVDLEHVPGLHNKKIRLGDTIRVKDTTFNPPLFVEARIYKQNRDIFNPSSKRVELGDYTEYTVEEIMENWESIRRELERKVKEAEERANWRATIGDIKFVLYGYVEPLKAQRSVVEGQYDELYVNPDLDNAIRSQMASVKARFDNAYDLLMTSIENARAKDEPSNDDLEQVNSQYNNYEVEQTEIVKAFEEATNNIAQKKVDDEKQRTDGRFDEMHEDLDRANEEIDRANIDLADARDRLEVAEQEIDAAISDLDTLERDLSDAREDINKKADNEEFQRIVGEIHEDLLSKVDGEWVDGRLATKADADSVYTIEDIDGMFDNTVSLTAYQTDKEGYIDRFENYETNITQTWEAIEARVTKSTYDAKMQTIDTEFTNISQTFNSITQTVGEVRQDLENLEIGGRNIVSHESLSSVAAKQTGYTFRLTRTSSSGNPYLRVSREFFELDSEYVATFKVKKISGNVRTMAGHASSFTSSVVYRDGVQVSTSWSSGDRNYPNDTETHSYTVYFKTPKSWPSDSAPYWYIQPNRSQYGEDYVLDIWDFQIEKGNKPTDWTPAPEDQQEFTYTQIRQLADEIDLSYVKNDEIVAAINLSDEGARIQGKNIRLDGNTQITGNLSAGDAEFLDMTTRRLTAIESTIQTATITGTITASNATFQSGTFNDITANNATIVDATITGTMTAGEIRGVDIIGSSFYSEKAAGSAIAGFTRIEGGDIVAQGLTSSQKVTISQGKVSGGIIEGSELRGVSGTFTGAVKAGTTNHIAMEDGQLRFYRNGVVAHTIAAENRMPSFFWNRELRSSGDYASDDHMIDGINRWPKVYIETITVTIPAGSNRYAVQFNDRILETRYNDMIGVSGAFASTDAQELYPTIVNMHFGLGGVLTGYDLRVRRLLDTSSNITTTITVLFIGAS